MLKYDTVSMTTANGCNLPYPTLIDPGIAMDAPILLQAEWTNLTAHAAECRKLDPLTAEDKPARLIQAGRVKSEEVRISAREPSDLANFVFSPIGEIAERYLLIGACVLESLIAVCPRRSAQQ
ncbi:MAG: hypothetical protein QM789_07745 [Paenirhodobacter sp.]